MKIKRIIGYSCDFCKKTTKERKEIEIYGQWEGRSDMSYEYHFCNKECLKKEITKEKNYDIYNSGEYLYILEEKYKKLNIKIK